MGAREARAGRAFVEIVTRENLQAGLTQAAGKLRAFSTVVAAVGAGVSAAAGSILGALSVALKQFSDSGDAIEKMAGRTGMATEAVSELAYAAGLSGTSVEELETGVKKMQETIADARAGSSAAAETLRRLGISMEDLAETPDAQLEVFANAIAQIEDPAVRTALAVDVFGRSGARLIPLLSGGAEGLKAMRAEAARLGQTVSGETAARAADLNDALGRLGAVVGRVGFSIAGALAPAVTRGVNAIAEIVGWVVKWIQENEGAVKITAAVAAAALALGMAITTVGISGLAASLILQGLAVVVGGLGTVAAAVGGALSGAFGLILGPVGLVAAAVVGLGVAFARFTTTGQQLLGALGESLGELGEIAGEAWTRIVEAFHAGDFQGILDAILGGFVAAFGVARDLFGELSEIADAAWQRITAGVLQAAGTIRSGWQSAIVWLAASWEQVSAAAGDAWVWIVDSASAAAAALPGLLQSAWDQIRAGAVAAAEALPGLLRSAWDSIVSGVSTAVAAIPGILSRAWEGVSSAAESAISSIPGRVQPAWMDIVAAAQQVLGRLAGLLFGTGETASLALAGGIRLAKSLIGGVLGSIWSSIASGAAESARRLVGPVGAAVELVAANWRSIVSVVGSVASNIGPIMSSLGATLLRPWDAVKGAVAAAVDGVAAIWASGVSRLPGFLQPVVNGIVAVAGLIFRPLVTAAAFVIDMVGTLFGGLVSIVMMPFGMLLQAWGAVWTTMQSLVVSTFQAVPAALATVWEWLKSTAGSVGTFIADTFSASLSLVQEAFAWVVQSATAYLGQIGQGFMDLGQGIASLFSELVADAGAAWEGISAALAIGDFAGAWEIAWNAIQMVFWKAIAPIQSGWAEFSTGLVSALDGALVVLRQSWSTATTWIAEQIFNLLGILQSALDKVAEFDPTGIAADLSASLAVDIDGAKKVLQEDRDRFQQQLDAAKAARDDARVAALKRAQDDIDKRIAALAKAHDDLTSKATDATGGKGIMDKIGPALSALGRFDPTTWLKGFDGNAIRKAAESGSDQVAAAVDPKGTFSAQAAMLLGFGGQNKKPEEETAKNTARIVEKLDEQIDAIEEIQPLQYSP